MKLGVIAALAAPTLLVVAGFLYLGVGLDALGGGPDAAALAREGGLLYAAHCASCHGAKLEGQTDWRERRPDGRLPAPPHDATGHTWHHSDEQLLRIIREGTTATVVPGQGGDMPGFGTVLSDRQIRAVLAFIKGSWPPEIRARQEAISH